LFKTIAIGPWIGIYTQANSLGHAFQVFVRSWAAPPLRSPSGAGEDRWKCSRPLCLPEDGGVI
jgi:hypothetical protein